MENLSIEMIVELVKYLPLYDQLKLRLLNKNWRSIIDQYFKIENLIVFNYQRENVWSCFNEDKIIDFVPLYEGNLSKMKIDLLVNIKRLVFGGACPISTTHYEYKFLINQLYKFENLKYLDIYSINSKEDNGTINCPQLTHLRIRFCYRMKKIKFDTPNLKSLVVNGDESYLEDLTFLHPETINYLKIRKIENNDGDPLNTFINVEYLHCRIAVFDSDERAYKLLKNLSKLKEIHLFIDREFMKNLIVQKKQQQKNNLKLFYGYVYLRNENYDLERLDSKREFEYLVENQSDLTDKFDFHDSLYYHEFDPYSDKVSEQFLEKFCCLEFINIKKKIINMDALIFILTKCKKISKIRFEKESNLSQTFYDNLPFLCPKLRFLKFDEWKSVNEELNLDFVFNFRYLGALILKEVSLLKDFLNIMLSKKNVQQTQCKIKELKGECLIDFIQLYCYYSRKKIEYQNLNELCLKLKQIDQMSNSSSDSSD